MPADGIVLPAWEFRYSIQESVEYFIRDDRCYQNNILESVFVDIDKDQVGKDRNVIAGVVYRPPDTDIDQFNTYISEIFGKIKSERKFVTCLGDYNIYLLSAEHLVT